MRWRPSLLSRVEASSVSADPSLIGRSNRGEDSSILRERSDGDELLVLFHTSLPQQSQPLLLRLANISKRLECGYIFSILS